MNFSEVFKLSNQLCRFSPNGKYLVSVRGGDWLGLGVRFRCCEGGQEPYWTLLSPSRLGVTSCAVPRPRSVHSTVTCIRGNVCECGGGWHLRGALCPRSHVWDVVICDIHCDRRPTVPCAMLCIVIMGAMLSSCVF